MKTKIKHSLKKYGIHIFALVVAVGIGGFMAARLGQDINFDLQNYHYANPHIFLNDRIEHDIAIGELESYANPLPDIPGYLLISHVRPRIAATGLGMIQGLNIFLIFEIVLLLLPRKRIWSWQRWAVALFVGILSFFGAGNISEVGNTMGDNLASLFVLGGLLLLLFSFSRPKVWPSQRLVRLAAYFVIGAGVGLKLTGVIYALALLAAGLLVEGSWVKKIKEGFFHGLAIGIGTLLTGGFWYLKLWQLFKSPIFPFYNAVFQSPYYPAKNFEDVRWIPKSLLHAVFAPFYYASKQALSSEIPFKDPRLAVAYTALVVLVGYFVVRKWVLKEKTSLPRWSKPHTAFWIFVVVSFVIWTAKFSYYRYLMPLELLALVAITTAVYTLVPRFTYATAAVVVVAVTITRLTVPIDWGRVSWRPTYFGVSKATFAHLENAAVLIPGFAPFGFTVPYFPESSQAIRIESDLSSPAMGTPAMQNKLRQAVEQKKRQNAPFYALKADEEAVATENTLNHFGFKTRSCQELPVYTRETIPLKFRLCELERLNQ
ncbi:MAG TPA: hypothetical protein VK694_02690 [Verrucomicrobiae bacterium]|nr:hypothetical protein [Verrucomicrobiae bacterium]